MVLRPILKSIQRKILRPIFTAVQRIFITLDAAQEGHFTIQNPVTFAGDFEVCFEFQLKGAPTNETILGNTASLNNYIHVRADTVIRARMNNVDMTFTVPPLGSLLHKAKVMRTSGTPVLILDDVSFPEDSLLTNSGSVTYGMIGQKTGIEFFDGIIANVDLGNGSAWQLDRGLGNTEQAANGNNLLTYVNIPTGAPDRELFTKNTSTDPDQWENADKSRIIEIA